MPARADSLQVGARCRTPFSVLFSYTSSQVHRSPCRRPGFNSPPPQPHIRSEYLAACQGRQRAADWLRALSVAQTTGGSSSSRGGAGASRGMVRWVGFGPACEGCPGSDLLVWRRTGKVEGRSPSSTAVAAGVAQISRLCGTARVRGSAAGWGRRCLPHSPDINPSRKSIPAQRTGHARASRNHARELCSEAERADASKWGTRAQRAPGLHRRPFPEPAQARSRASAIQGECLLRSYAWQRSISPTALAWIAGGYHRQSLSGSSAPPASDSDGQSSSARRNAIQEGMTQPEARALADRRPPWWGRCSLSLCQPLPGHRRFLHFLIIPALVLEKGPLLGRRDICAEPTGLPGLEPARAPLRLPPATTSSLRTAARRAANALCPPSRIAHVDIPADACRSRLLRLITDEQDLAPCYLRSQALASDCQMHAIREQVAGLLW